MAESGSELVDDNVDKKGHHHHHHAHFVIPQQQDDLAAHDSKVLIEPVGDNILQVRLGFLQIKHIYQVQFTIEDDLGEDLTFDILENLHVKIETANPSENGRGHEIVLNFSAYKEKIVKESVTISSKDDPSKNIILELHARVLGKGKGTPSLKTGIHCIGIDQDEDTEDSDWQEF